MYTRNNLWDLAHKVAKMYMSEQEISALYINQAQQYEVLLDLSPVSFAGFGPVQVSSKADFLRLSGG